MSSYQVHPEKNELMSYFRIPFYQQMLAYDLSFATVGELWQLFDSY